MKNNRIYWIDWAKSIGIFLVILGHMQMRDDLLIFIFAFHMPLFFFISGYLEKNDTISKVIKKSINRLIVPYIFFFMITFLWYILITNPFYYYNGITQIYINCIKKPMIGLFLGVGYSTKYSQMINPPLWFLVGLFFCKIIHRLLKEISNSIGLIIISLFLAVVFDYIIKYFNIDLWFSIDSSIMALPFFTMGYYMRQNGKFLIPKKKILILLIVLLILPLFWFASQFNGFSDINRNITGKSIYAYYIIGIIGIIFIINLSVLLSDYLKKIISFISSGTIVILAFHQIATGILIKVLNFEVSFITNQLIIAVICIIVLFIPIFIINKYFSFLLGVKIKKKFFH